MRMAASWSRSAWIGAVLLHQPLARAVELQPRAVDQQVHGAGIAASAATRTVAARLRPRHLQRLGPAAQGGVVRHGEVEPEQADDGADQPFGLPVRQPEHGLERQRRQDRQVGILGLPAPARAPLGLPRLDRLVRKPDRQAATPAQALVVITPVRDLALLLRDVVASVLVQLEGQGGHPGSDGGLPCYLDRAPGATRGIPATTWRSCHVFVLLVSAHSMASNYIIDKEIAIIRERQAKGEAVHFYPIVLTPTPQAGLDKVRDKNLRPRDGRPLSSFSYSDRCQHMSDAADEIASVVESMAKQLGDQQPQDTKPPHSEASPISNIPIRVPVPALFMGRDDA